MKTNHSDSRYRRLALQCIAIGRANGSPCAICGYPINYDAEPRTRWSPTAHHLDPPSLGHPVVPTLDRLAPAHMACNSSYGNGTKPMKMRVRVRKRLRKSGAW